MSGSPWVALQGEAAGASVGEDACEWGFFDGEHCLFTAAGRAPIHSAILPRLLHTHFEAIGLVVADICSASARAW